MQTTRNFIGVFVELASCMKHSHDHLERRFFLLGMNVRRDTSSIIFYRDRIIFINFNRNVTTIAGHRLIYGIVYHFPNQMMQSFYSHITDIHGRSLPYCFKSFKYLNITG